MFLLLPFTMKNKKYICFENTRSAPFLNINPPIHTPLPSQPPISTTDDLFDPFLDFPPISIPTESLPNIIGLKIHPKVLYPNPSNLEPQFQPLLATP